MKARAPASGAHAPSLPPRPSVESCGSTPPRTRMGGRRDADIHTRHTQYTTDLQTSHTAASSATTSNVPALVMSARALGGLSKNLVPPPRFEESQHRGLLQCVESNHILCCSKRDSAKKARSSTPTRDVHALCSAISFSGELCETSVETTHECLCTSVETVRVLPLG